MNATVQIIVRITKAQRAALERIRVRDGLTIRYQVQHAIAGWLNDRHRRRPVSRG